MPESKKEIRKDITQKRLKELFEYECGKLIRIKTARGWGAHRGTDAGTMGDGYCHISIDGCRYKRSRLVWLYHNGYIPENDIDHIDRVKDNDKIENLREVAQMCNTRNTGNFKNNTSGVKGVYWDKVNTKWRSLIAVNKKSYFLGLYKSFDDAVCARLAAEQCLDWDGCDSRSPAFTYVQDMLE